MKTHSEKAHETFAQMNTVAGDWGLTPIKWVKEKMLWPVKVRCKTCHGVGQARFKNNGTLWVNKVDYEKDYYRHSEETQRIWREGIRKQCPTCPPKRNYVGYGTGEVTEMKMMEVMVGYTQWTPGTVFDSRFVNHNRSNCRVCQLCSKTIKSSNLVPVNGKSPDGVIHGMWVGMDCARKFLGIKAFAKNHVIKLEES